MLIDGHTITGQSLTTVLTGTIPLTKQIAFSTGGHESGVLVVDDVVSQTSAPQSTGQLHTSRVGAPYWHPIPGSLQAIDRHTTGQVETTAVEEVD